MHKKLFLFLGLSVILAISAFGQNNSVIKSGGPNSTARLTNLETALKGFLESDDDETNVVPERPRIVEEKAAAVKASAIVRAATVERLAFDMLNQKRMENGLAQLTWSDDVANVARIHSQNMAEYNFFSHRGLDNKMVSDRADANGVKKWRAIGENIALNRGYGDPVAKAVEQWLNSPSHMHNLMDSSWKESAVGVAIAEDGSYYFTQVFLKK